jgi:hypothetical protein
MFCKALLPPSVFGNVPIKGLRVRRSVTLLIAEVLISIIISQALLAGSAG